MFSTTVDKRTNVFFLLVIVSFASSRSVVSIRLEVELTTDSDMFWT